MGFDLGHTISSVSKFALRTKRRIDKNDESNIKVYELWLDHTYRTYETLTKDGYRTYEFEGKKVENRKFDLIYPSKYKDELDKPIGDVFSITPSSYIMNEKAYKILYPYLKSHSQIFKINNNGTIFYVINVTDLIDCLDYDNSEIKRFPSSGRIMRVIKYVFKNEKLKNVTIFKLPEFPKAISYVTEEFKNVVEENNIKGFKFKEL